jgi:hypothetical protein
MTSAISETQSRSNQSSKQSYRTTAAWSPKRYHDDPLKRAYRSWAARF